MNMLNRLLTLAALLLCAIAGCSKPPSADAVAGSNDVPPTAVVPGPKSSAATTRFGNACDRQWLTIADAADILPEPIVGTKPLHGDPQTCYLITAAEASGGPSIMVSVRPGLGRATVTAWADGSMPFAGSPVSGVGDSAVWVSPTHEINAQKDDMLCNISAAGARKELIGDPSELQRKLSALCNRIFAAATR
jgi:hypothetical protein